MSDAPSSAAAETEHLEHGSTVPVDAGGEPGADRVGSTDTGPTLDRDRVEVDLDAIQRDLDRVEQTLDRLADDTYFDNDNDDQDQVHGEDEH